MSNLLADKKEVVPRSSSDGMVNNGPRWGIVEGIPDYIEKSRANPFLNDNEAQLGIRASRALGEDFNQLSDLQFGRYLNLGIADAIAKDHDAARPGAVPIMEGLQALNKGHLQPDRPGFEKKNRLLIAKSLITAIFGQKSPSS